MTQCLPDTHRWEWFRERAGVIDYRCLDCGEMREQYIDCGGGC